MAELNLKFKHRFLFALPFLILLVIAYFLSTHMVRINGTSMYPTLKNGDYLIIQRGNNGNLTNKIVVLHIGVIHRVVEEKDGFVLTKGDANAILDGWIPRQAIIGKVIFVLPFWFFNSLQIFCIIVFVLTFVVLLIKLRRKKLSRDREMIDVST